MTKRLRPSRAVRDHLSESRPGDVHQNLRSDQDGLCSGELPLVHWPLAIIAFAVIAIQPISSDELWWQASRGRQVLATANLRPSVELLVNEQRGEANGVGTVVAAMAFRWFGASGWMALRIAAIAGAAWWLTRWPLRSVRGTRTSTSPWLLWLIVTSTFALSRSFDPVPMLFDLIAIALLAVLIDGLARPSVPASAPHEAWHPWRQFGSFAALFVFWANFGNYVLIGLVVVWFLLLNRAVGRRRSERRWSVMLLDNAWPPIAITPVFAMLNPIGWWVWFDSFAQLVPWLVAPPWVLAETAWIPLTRTAWGVPEIWFAGLTTLWCLSPLTANQRADELVPMLAVQFFAWTSAAVLPLATVWVLMGFVRSCKVWQQPIGARTPLLFLGRARMFSHHLLPAIAVLIVAIASTRTAGWGIEADLDPRMLEIALSDIRDPGTVLANDRRSAGMIAWVMGPVTQRDADGERAARLQDEPFRALVGRRLVDQRRIFRDLREGRQMSYWREGEASEWPFRDDSGSAMETQGGWWLPLAARKTSLLVCTRRDLKLIRGLEPTVWKPLSLDSPVLPFAIAGSPLYTTRIVEVLNQRELVDSGAWSYRPPQSTGSGYDRDRFGILAPRLDADQTFDQADVFIAMELWVAALSALTDARQRWPRHPRFLPAWQRCQVELADQEIQKVGRASRMRSIAAGNPLGAREEESIGTDDRADRERESEYEQWVQLVTVYRNEGAAAALARCETVADGQNTLPDGTEPSESSQEALRYAAICWAIEVGRSEDAKRWARMMISDAPRTSIPRLLAQHQLDWLLLGDENGRAAAEINR